MRLYILDSLQTTLLHTMPLFPLLGLALWVVVTAGQEPGAAGHILRYQLQDDRGGYKFGYKTADQMAEAEGNVNSEVKGKYAYVDEHGDMQGVEYTAGVNGYKPKVLSKEDAEASILVPTIMQPNTEDGVPINDHLENRPKALHYSKRSEIEVEQEDEVDEITDTSTAEKDFGKTNSKTHFNESETINPTYKEKNKSGKEEIVRGKYTFIEEDGIPATIEYEAGPEIGFVVKGFTKESLQSRLLQKGSDTVNDKDGLQSAPDKPIYNEEGTEETYPEGFVRGLYTFTDEDGVSATVEYEAGPKLGFVVKKVSMGDMQLDQLGQGTGTSFNNSIVIVPSSIQQDSPEGESIKFNVYNNETPIESLTEESLDYFYKSRPKVMYDDATQIPSFKKDLSTQNDTRVHSLEPEDLVEKPDEEDEKEIPMNAAYRFEFSVQDQSRHEKSDASGNVNGNYSYVDGAGLLTKVEYEAGAKKGFIIKRMTHEHTKTPKTMLISEINQIQNISLPGKDDQIQDSLIKEDDMRKETHTEKHNVSNKHKTFNNQRESFYEKMMDGYEVSPYALREYVNERNLPVRSGFGSDSGSSDIDSAVASESTNHFTYAHPESRNFKSDGSYFYNSPHKSETVKKHYFPQEAKTDFTQGSYSIFVRDTIDSENLQEVPTVKSYSEYFSQLPVLESRPDNRQFDHNVLNKRVEPYRAVSNPGFPVYGPPLIDLPTSIVSLRPDSTRKSGVVHKQKHHHKRKKIVKRPVNMTSNQNFTEIQPDGSYSFAYKAKDHSREQSIDQNGKVNYRYQINTKKDGNTLVIFSTQVPKNLVTTNDEGTWSPEKGKDNFAGI